GLDAEFPVPSLAERVLIKRVGEGRASRNLVEMPVQSIRCRNEAPRKELLDRTRLQFPGNIGVAKQRRQFTRKCDAAGLTVNVERFLSKPIASKEESTPCAVIDRKRKHTVKTSRQLFAPLPVAVNQNLGIGVRGSESVTCGLEGAAKFDVIVDFAVI